MDNAWTLAGIVVLGVFQIVQARLARKSNKQLHPNGGSSLADAVARIEVRADRISEDVGHLKSQHEQLARRFDNHVDGRTPRTRRRKDAA